MMLRKIDKNNGLVVFVLLVASILFLAVNSSSAQPIKEVKVGVLLPMTGVASGMGKECWTGAEFAAEKINQSGGIKSLGGAKIVLIRADTESKPTVGHSQVRKLADEGVVAIVGALQSAVSIVFTQEGERLKIPGVVCASISDKITARGLKYTFKINAPSSYFIRDEMQFYKEMGKKNNIPIETLGILVEDSATGKIARSNIKKFAPELGYKIVADLVHPVGTSDMTSEINKAKAAKPDILFGESNYSQMVLMVKTAREFDFNVKGWASLGNAANPHFRNAVGAIGEGIISVSSWNRYLNVPGSKEYCQAYEKKYGAPPASRATLYHTGLFLIKDGLERAGSIDRTKLRDAISARKGEVPGSVIGFPVEFNSGGQNIRVKVVMEQNRMRGGKLDLVPVYPLEIAPDKPVFPTPTWKERGL